MRVLIITDYCAKGSLYVSYKCYINYLWVWH
jgi:hypothetical protein